MLASGHGVDGGNGILLSMLKTLEIVAVELVSPGYRRCRDATGIVQSDRRLHRLNDGGQYLHRQGALRCRFGTLSPNGLDNPITIDGRSERDIA
jgi:hypothetical protein